MGGKEECSSHRRIKERKERLRLWDQVYMGREERERRSGERGKGDKEEKGKEEKRATKGKLRECG